ncbi:MAG: endonuclease [Anaerolineae bacterium]|jgi:predicted Holliday junction resolvase-like endonuclease|nr:endonuclease [Anaerolineae bacterium]
MDSGLGSVALVLLGILIGVMVSAWLSRHRERVDRDILRDEVSETLEARAETERARIVRAYEAQMRHLVERHREEVSQVRTATVNQSRAVLKGKMAEQVAPLLPGFAYWPADARFLGDPVDYVIFDGYSACKDNHTDGSDIEVVILDIKRGQASLTREQRRIAEAVASGRVRFEVVRVLADGTIDARRWPDLNGSAETGSLAREELEI